MGVCPQVMSQAPQHFKYSETQATDDDCCARQKVCSVISLDSAQYCQLQESWDVDVSLGVLFQTHLKSSLADPSGVWEDNCIPFSGSSGDSVYISPAVWLIISGSWTVKK